MIHMKISNLYAFNCHSNTSNTTQCDAIIFTVLLTDLYTMRFEGNAIRIFPGDVEQKNGDLVEIPEITFSNEMTTHHSVRIRPLFKRKTFVILIVA